ncbi:Severe Depolymerization of Actin [Tulasnella sp. 330]|nr:Severe Depolymerization of Actin [Tulasnella sp. 330]KAG8883656.1 Severe Depolymerization of Actin [Tulasnella sp. 331]
MDRAKKSRGALLINNLPQLQNLIKRDPAGYREEFLQQWNHYDSIRCLYEAKPDDSEGADRFRELVTFISQVCQCYKEETKDFPAQITSLLLEHYSTLTPELRKTLVQSLVLLRNKDVITSIDLLKTLFPLLPRTPSTTLRSYIRSTILSDIKTANARTKNHKLNKAVQVMLFGMVERGMDAEVMGDKGKVRGQVKGEKAGKGAGDEAMWAVAMVKELWKKNVWNDAKTVSIVTLGCFHPVTKVQNACLHFFLGSDDDKDESEEEDEGPDLRKLAHQRQINKKTKGTEAQLTRAKKKAKKVRLAKESGLAATPNFPALQLLHDPQNFGEKLYDLLHRFDRRFSLDHKILIMQLLSRVMGVHKLCVLSFYPYITKYLTYHQMRVTSILVCLAQSCHDLTPPDVLTPVIRKVAHEFVTPGVAAEVVSAGLNSIREVSRRQPWCMEEDLLGDLIEYRKSKDKGVVTAARSLLALFREVNPAILKKRERGKFATMDLAGGKVAGTYGQSEKPAITVEGLQLLEDHFEQLRTEMGDVGGNGVGEDEEEDEDAEDAGWEGWDVESDSSDDGAGWISVSSEDEDLVISDSDDDEETKAKNRLKAAKGKGKAKEVAPSSEAGDEDAMMADDATSTVEYDRVSSLATTKILTPADFALLNDLRLKQAAKLAESGGGSAAKRKLAELQSIKKSNHGSNNPDAADPNAESAFLTEGDLLGPRKKARATYEERIASIQEGREGRGTFGSKKGKKQKENPSSSTNREKKRNKPLMMVLGSQGVKSKKQASLRDKQKRLRKHIDLAKKTHH